jgi:AAA family ATP:ADP antiporter
MAPSHDDGVSARRIQGGEWQAVALSFLYFFCVLAAYYVIRPVARAAFGRGRLDPVALVLCGHVPGHPRPDAVFGGLVARYPRRVVVPVVYVFFILCLFGFIPLFTQEGLLSPRALGTVFFVWVSVFNLFVVSVFWSFMADIWSAEQSKRLFPIIAVAGTAGAVTGPALTRALVDVIGVAPLLVVSASLLGIAVVCIVLLGRWARVHGARRHEAANEAAIGGSMFDGLRQIFADPFMRGMAVLLLLADGIGTVNYALVADYSGATFTDAVARTALCRRCRPDHQYL